MPPKCNDKRRKTNCVYLKRKLLSLSADEHHFSTFGTITRKLGGIRCKTDKSDKHERNIWPCYTCNSNTSSDKMNIQFVESILLFKEKKLLNKGEIPKQNGEIDR